MAQAPRCGLSIGRPSATLLSQTGSGIVSLALLGLAWQACCARGWFPPESVPTPGMVWDSLVKLRASGALWSHSRVSVERLAEGLSAGAALGLVLGILLGAAPRGSVILKPIVSILSPIPPLIWTPVLIAVFGIDNSRIALVGIPTCFLVALGCAGGMRGVDLRYAELGRAFGMNWAGRLRFVLLPGATQSIFGSLRTAAALSWTVLVFAEMIASSGGLGWLINDARTFGRKADVGAGALAVAALAVATDAALLLAQRRLTRWQRTYEDMDRGDGRA